MQGGTVLSPYVLGLVYTVHDTGYSLSPPLLTHSCLAKARARWNESEREPLKASEDGTRQTLRAYIHGANTVIDM